MLQISVIYVNMFYTVCVFDAYHCYSNVMYYVGFIEQYVYE